MRELDLANQVCHPYYIRSGNGVMLRDRKALATDSPCRETGPYDRKNSTVGAECSDNADCALRDDFTNPRNYQSDYSAVSVSRPSA